MKIKKFFMIGCTFPQKNKFIGNIVKKRYILFIFLLMVFLLISSLDAETLPVLPSGNHTQIITNPGSSSTKILTKNMPYFFVNDKIEHIPDIKSFGNQTITLTPNEENGASELINLGIPFPPGVLTDATYVKIMDDNNSEVAAFVKPVLTWHFKDFSIRAVKVQFYANMTNGARVFHFEYSSPRKKNLTEQPYDNGSKPGKEGVTVPRILTTLTPEWMTSSLIAGELTPISGTGKFDRFWQAQWVNFQENRSYTEDSSMWLYDRPSTIMKQYIRTGDPGYLKEAINSYRFYSAHIVTNTSQECAGGFELGDVDACNIKYVYLRPSLLMMALTGDDIRLNRTNIDLMTSLWEAGGWYWPPFTPYTTPDQAWTERQGGIGLAELTAAYEITADPRYFEDMNNTITCLYNHIKNNPDGYGFDGSWRHSHAMHEGDPYPGNIPADRGGSPWMSALIIGGLHDAYQVRHDSRIPEMVLAFARYAEEYAWIPKNWNGHDSDNWTHICNQENNGTIVGYWSSSTANFSTLFAIQDEYGYHSDEHNAEMRLPIAWAYRLESDAVQKQKYFQRLLKIENYFNPDCATLPGPARMFHWQHRNGPEAQTIISQDLSSLDNLSSDFIANLTAGSIPLSVQFTDTSITQLHSWNWSAWNWSFGDGNYSTAINPEHTYMTAGNYTVSLTVHDMLGTASNTKTSYIKASPLIIPVANFIADNVTGKEPLKVHFTDLSDNFPTSWNWSFGDNTFSIDRNPSHLYTIAGNYTVSLIATNAKGSNTCIKTNYIKVSENPLPSFPIEACFITNVTAGTPPLTVGFFDTSTGNPSTWNWSFGDGTTSTARNPVHIYTTTGNYSVSLLISNGTNTDLTVRDSLIQGSGITPCSPSGITMSLLQNGVLIGNGEGQFDEPKCISIVPDGTSFVTDIFKP